jgi:cyclohexa-1,5-dienecarbonyl-CoA hydratase
MSAVDAVPGTDKVVATLRFDGQVLDLKLNAPKGNVLDSEMMGGLSRAIDEYAGRDAIKAIVFRGEGPHFSFGASVPEHTREKVAGMLATFHGLLKSVLECGRPTFAVVRGQCLGGGMELVSTCHWIFASGNAAFGQPEIKLGVFAPAASVLLPWRVGQSAADDLVLSGRSIDAARARELGLVHSVSDDPDAALDAFLEDEILGKSAASLRYGVMAARRRMIREVGAELDAVERMYVDELMATEDANEGIGAFLEKRKPEWRNR